MTDDTKPPPQSTAVLTSQQLAATAPRARLRELSPKTMWLTAVVIAVLTAAAVVVLWWPATRGLNGAELVSARLDALKVGLSVAVGSGGLVALYLSWRRQHSTEADLDNRAHDAAERRLTELYLKAVEQLGSPQAAVRHGGLYALERVAQDNPHQRQTVVNVICAYLRNPYVPPSQTGQPRPLGIQRPLLRSATTTGRSATTPSRDGSREAQLQEREVRLTAQRILQLHLHPGPDPDHPQPTFWRDIDLDLTSATLINFGLRGCAVAAATFDGATFTGDAWFADAIFTGNADFRAATFTGNTWFADATFTDDAKFDRATFTDYAGFRKASFTGDAWFRKATFTGNTDFCATTFTGNTWFADALFTDDAVFSRATFTGLTGFNGANFTGSASFSGAIFNNGAGFSAVTFNGNAWFDGATFTRDANFDRTTFNGNFKFDEATRRGLPLEPTTYDASLPDGAPPDPIGGAP